MNPFPGNYFYLFFFYIYIYISFELIELFDIIKLKTFSLCFGTDSSEETIIVTFTQTSFIDKQKGKIFMYHDS